MTQRNPTVSSQLVGHQYHHDELIVETCFRSWMTSPGRISGRLPLGCEDGSKEGCLKYVWKAQEGCSKAVAVFNQLLKIFGNIFTIQKSLRSSL